MANCKRRLAIVATACLIALSAAGCGSDSATPVSDTTAAAAAEDAEAIPSKVVRPGDTFTTDSFVAAGWKKSKEYSTETVPDADSIWYGFFNQRDVEIRFYDSHDKALQLGAPVVETAILENVKRSRGGRLLDFSGGSFSAYAAYIVAGNAILLCELDISPCEGLAARLN